MLVHRLKWLLSASLLISMADARTLKVPSSEFKTIGDALANSDAGDTVRVARGTYNENVTLVQGVTLLGENPLNTIIDGGRSGPTVYGVAGGIIKNFTIRNGIEGVLCENAPATVENNWIIDNHASGVAAFISLPSIANNVIYGNRWSGILVWGAKSYDSRIEQNVIMRNGFSGVSLMGPSNVNLRNNIFMENMYYGIFAENAAGMSKVENNDIFRNYFAFNRYVTVPRSNFNVDPKFIAFTLGKPNFFVSARSALKERGKGECLPGKKCDIGLVERLPVEKITAQDMDSDRDGIVDAEDKCPNDMEDIDGYQDDDGCPDIDNDQDGIADKMDKCANEAEDKDGTEDFDGCPDVDNDKDGFCDAWVSEKGLNGRYEGQCKGVDRCPDQAEVINDFMDDDGCPDQKVEAPKAGASISLNGITFKTGSAVITPESEAELRKGLGLLLSAPEAKFEIRGHTDNKGDKIKNQKLSEARAKSVTDWMIANGIGADRLIYKGMGQTKPIADNKTEAGRSKNRRIEFYRVQ